MSGTLIANDVAASNGATKRNLPRGVAAAWVNLNGTGTVAVRGSENISGVTDNGVGDYTFGFIAAMANINYGFGSLAALNTVLNTATQTMKVQGSTAGMATGGLRTLSTQNVGTTLGAAADFEINSLNVFGDLA